MSDYDFERVAHFPMKLWHVVNDESGIFRWNKNGDSFFVDDRIYEEEIMEKYPGFVQIASFANLRRLLREYSFNWQNNESGEFEFSHPSFKRGRCELLANIRTKRKAIQVATGQPIMKYRRRSSGDLKSVVNSPEIWLQSPNTGRVNLRVDTLMRFPEKFWTVVNDTNDLLYWSEDGDAVIVDDKKYEEEIMTKYPGFVKINTFPNLRRLLREYGFSWNIRENGFYEFSHTHMKRGKPELLKGVKTKRKAIKTGVHHPYLSHYKSDSSYFGYQNPFSMMEPLEYLNRIYRSSEINQAIGSIHGLNLDPKEYIQQNSGDQFMQGSGYGFAPYKLMQSYPHPSPHAQLPQTSTWPLNVTGEKVDGSLCHQWSNMHPLNNFQSFDQNSQLSPSVPRESNSAVQTSSTGSCESAYASSKGSPVETVDDPLNEPDADLTSEAFQSMISPHSDPNRFYQTNQMYDGAIPIQNQQYCEAETYHTVYRPKCQLGSNCTFSGANRDHHHPDNNLMKVNEGLAGRDNDVRLNLKLFPLTTNEHSTEGDRTRDRMFSDQRCDQNDMDDDLRNMNNGPFDLTKTRSLSLQL